MQCSAAGFTRFGKKRLKKSDFELIVIKMNQKFDHYFPHTYPHCEASKISISLQLSWFTSFDSFLSPAILDYGTTMNDETKIFGNPRNNFAPFRSLI